MLYTLVLTYLLGGITFIPLLALLTIAYAFYTSVPAAPSGESKLVSSSQPKDDDSAPATPTLKAWLTVRHTFESSPTSYVSIVRTLLDSRGARTRRADDSYYGVLKRFVLYLYEDEEMMECAAAIDVRRCRIRIFPDDEDLLDGELFAKRNAILLSEKDSGGKSAAPKPDSTAVLDKDKRRSLTPDALEWFIFFRSAHDMEDWYFTFLNAPSPFPHSAQRALIDALDALPDRIPTRWLNALLGRLFLGVKGTRVLQEWVLSRITKKLSRVKTPSWLTAVVVRNVDPGDVPPVFSKPMLKQLTPEGEASVGVDFSYVAPRDGGVRITLSATASISLPNAPSLSMLGFKNKEKAKEQPERQYDVSLVLAVIVRKVEGNMLIKIKPPPSNRLWYAFTSMPRMDIEIKPVVSDRQIRWGMVLSGIEGKLREIIQDSVVMPNMDDIPFFDTSSLSHRGGLFADAFPSSDPVSSTTPDSLSPAELPAEPRIARSTEVVVETTVVQENADRTSANTAATPRRVETFTHVSTTSSSAGDVMRRRHTWIAGHSEEVDERSEAVEKNEKEHEADEAGAADKAQDAMLQPNSKDDDVANMGMRPSNDDNEGSADNSTRPFPPSRTQSLRSTSYVSHFADDESSLLSDGVDSVLSKSAPSHSSTYSASQPPTPNASTSFLAALKSRGAGMAEKQPALKEAMRKWGGTWAAALRKGDKERQREMESDHGEFWAGEEKGTSSRGNYAELRRKVEQRERERARERGRAQGDSYNDDSSKHGNSVPLDIPSTGGKEVVTVTRQRSMSASTSPLPPEPDSSVRNTRTQTSGGPLFLNPSPPKPTTELNTSVRTPTSPNPQSSGSTSIQSSAPEGMLSVQTDPFAPAVPPSPIRAQPPKAATMTIPGIHAKHRGDLMAFGSSPPIPLTDVPRTTTDAPTTMQNIYKLLKSERREQDSPPASSSSAKPTPPALPPRSVVAKLPVSGSVGVPDAPAAQETVSRASHVLKSLAELDSASRQALPSSPLPPPEGESVVSEDDPDVVVAAAAGGDGGDARDNIAGPRWKPPLPPRPRQARDPEHA